MVLQKLTHKCLPYLPGLRIGVGPGFDSQGSVTLFLKYCFPNLHWIHGKAIEVEACEFVPVQHPRKWLSTTIDSAYMSWKAPPVNLQSWIRIQSPSATCLKG